MNRELEMAKLACRALDEKKGKDIKVIDIHEVSVIADYFVIASASNQNQVQAMVDNVDETLGRAGFEAKQIEGTRNSSWVLAMHRLYANRIKSRGMSRVFCDLRSQKTPRGILPVNSNEKFTVIRCRAA